MDEKKHSLSFRERLEYVLSQEGHPLMTVDEYQIFIRDIIYLLDTGRKNIQFYAWECEDHIQSVPAPSTLSTSSTLLDDGVEIASSASVDSLAVSHPCPTDFDASEQESQDRVVITIKEGEELNNEDRLVFDGYVARFLVGEFTLAKGRSTDSMKNAMSELFSRVHVLAEEYRAKEEEERRRDEERRVAREEAEKIAAE